MPKILNKRGTRANLNTLASANGLSAGEVYLITDENRIAIGTSVNTYETYAKQSESTQFDTNVNTFLTTPSSANFAAALTDETGTGSNVFAISPTLVTPVLGTPASGTLTNCTNAVGYGLKSATTTVSVSAATAPTTGQVLTATAGTTATWQTPKSIATTTLVLKGNNAGGAVAATAGTDYAGITTSNAFTVGQTIQGLKLGTGSSTSTTNTALGLNALSGASNTGTYNTGVGSSSLSINSVGTYNTGVGSSSLSTNSVGTNNTGVGANCLLSNGSGTNNTGVGANCLLSNIVTDNTGVGSASLYGTTSGTGNTAIGSASLYANTSGIENVAIGHNGLQNNTTGSNNTAINPMDSAGAYSPVFNPITTSNRFCMGSTGVTNAYIKVAWTVVSDARDKTNFSPVPHGLKFVKQLQPTAYQYKVNRETDIPTGIVRYGFKAQDILSLEGDNPVVVDNEDDSYLRFNESSLIPILVNAIKELAASLELLEGK